MSAKKLLILTAVVAALFAFIVLYERKLPTTAERERKGDLYWNIPQERLTKLTLTRGAETLEFGRTGDGPWHMVLPAPYPADTFAVGSLVTELTELKQAGGGDAGDGRPSEYGLDKPVASAKLVWTDPDDPKTPKTRTLEFGADVPGTDITAAQVAGQGKVLFVPSSTLASVRKPIDDFRSREVFDGATSGVSRVEILRGRGRLVLSRKDGVWWLSEPVADLADATVADDLVRRLTGLRVTEFQRGGEDLAALSLNPPLYRVSLTNASGAVIAVDFGATRSDGNSVYARRDGQVVTVEREIVDELSKEAEPFRSPGLVTFNRGDVTAINATFARESFALTQENGGWSAKGKPVLAASADDVVSLLSGLKGKGFVDDAAAKALAPATATVVLKMKTGPGWTIALHPRPSDAVATVSSRPGGIVVDADTADKIEAALSRALAPQPTPAPSPKR